jgi:uncharacterized protein with NRDE domain
MCTLIALHRLLPGATLVVAANRDEFYDRPAEGPALRVTPSGTIAAPLDLKAGGTWSGLNRAGVFAAVTNVSCPDPDPERRSRGRLVVDVLGARSAREAAEKIEGMPMGAYNPFNLFVADAHDAFAFTYQERVRRGSAEGGAFVIGNVALDAPEPVKLAKLRSRVEHAAARAGDAALDELAELCRDHEPGPRGPLDAVCVHTAPYGTRSSFLLRLAEGGPRDSRSVFRHAEGAPCENEYEDFTPLLRELGQGGPACREPQRGPKT